MFNKINDVIFFRAFRGTHDAYWLIQDNKNKVVFALRFDDLPVDSHRVTSSHLITDRSALAIDVHITLLNKAVSVSARAYTAGADVFI
jgi:hypothetical protein